MKIMYIGNIGYPNTAPSVHVRNRGYFMNSCGHDVYAFCEAVPDEKKMSSSEELTYYYMEKLPGKGKIRGTFWNLDQVFGMFYFKQTKKIVSKIRPDIVILYEPNSIIYVLAMMNLGKKECFKLVIESTEWRNPKDYKGVITRIINTEKDFQKKYTDKRVGNTIAISSYLNEHYLKQKCNTILLPPIFPEGFTAKENEMDVQVKTKDNPVKLVYAGAMASKDYIDTLIKALIQINCEKIKITFDIIGPTKEQIEKLVMNNSLEKFGIKCHGRLSHEETIRLVSKSDVSVLLRRNKRYAKAGVSTKFCEAMLLGVPSICTSVGGTDQFVIGDVNGFLVKDNDMQTLKDVLLRILDLPREQLMEIKHNALITAKQVFLGERYVAQFNDFLTKCR